jgi:hypothetical protein
VSVSVPLTEDLGFVAGTVLFGRGVALPELEILEAMPTRSADCDLGDSWEAAGEEVFDERVETWDWFKFGTPTVTDGSPEGFLTLKMGGLTIGTGGKIGPSTTSKSLESYSDDSSDVISTGSLARLRQFLFNFLICIL